MSVVNAGVYEVRLYQDLFGQEVLNVFHYFRGGGDNDGSGELKVAFLGTNVPAIAAVQSQDLQYVRVEVESVLGIDVPDTSVIVGLQGGIASDSLPAQYVFSLRYNRTDKSTRNGGKRFSGLAKIVVEDNDLTSDYVASLQGLANILEAPLPSSQQSFIPIIMRRPTTPNPANVTINIVGSVSALDRASTQRTRLNY